MGESAHESGWKFWSAVYMNDRWEVEFLSWDLMQPVYSYANFFFFFSLNSSFNSLKLYFPLIHSRVAGKNGLLRYKLLPVLALKVVQDGWSPRGSCLGLQMTCPFTSISYNHFHVSILHRMQIWETLLFPVYEPSRCSITKRDQGLFTLCLPLLTVSHNLLSSIEDFPCICLDIKIYTRPLLSSGHFQW